VAINVYESPQKLGSGYIILRTIKYKIEMARVSHSILILSREVMCCLKDVFGEFIT
jgi:hypothetical protein